MTRYKKELRKRGYKLNCDYPYLPYNTTTALIIDGIYTTITKEYIIVTRVYNVGVEKLFIGRDFTVVNLEFY